MALVFNNPVHDIIVNDMYDRAGSLLGKAAIPVMGGLYKGIMGGKLNDYQKPIKDKDGNITGYEQIDFKGLRGILPKLGEDKNTPSLLDRARDFTSRIGYGEGQWAPGKFIGGGLLGLGGGLLNVGKNIARVPGNIKNEVKDVYQDARQKRILKREDKRAAEEAAYLELENAARNAPRTLDFIPPINIASPSSTNVDIAPIESPYGDLDSIIKESPYYDSTLSVDTGALDNVDTSNVQPLPSLLDRIGVSEETEERYPVSEETDPNIKLSYPDNNIGGPLGVVTGGGKPQPGYTNQNLSIARDNSEYYDPILSMDTGALDNVDTSNVRPISMSGPLGGALGGALEPSPSVQDSLGNRNNNPGNIKFAGQKGAVKEGDFAKFDTMEDGWKALYRQVELDTGRGDTIETFIKGKDGTGGYSEDNQDAYVNFISDKVGYPPDTPLSAIDPQFLVSAIAMMEGTIDSTDFAPSLDELTPKKAKENRNILDTIIKRGYMPIDSDSIRQQNLQQQDLRRKIRGF
jgi:hypothetical protein